MSKFLTVAALFTVATTAAFAQELEPKAYAASPGGASFTMQAPSGQYDPARLINLGNHRWAFKPELGVAVPKGRWDIDAYAGVWLFTANDNFFPRGLEHTQDHVVAMQGHVSYTFKPRLWLAVDSTWYSSGPASVVQGGV